MSLISRHFNTYFRLTNLYPTTSKIDTNNGYSIKTEMKILDNNGCMGYVITCTRSDNVSEGF